MASVNSAVCWRLRFGIGRPEHPDVAAYVLSDFSSDERSTLGLVWPEAASLLEGIFREGPEPFVKEWGKKRVVEI